MERERALARKSAILGPVIAIVDQFQSGDRKGATCTMQEFLEGTGGGFLEAGYQLWRKGLGPDLAKIIADLVQEDPKREKGVRNLFFESALDKLMWTGQVVRKP